MDGAIRLHPRPVRRALRASNLSGTFVVGKYRLSPYMACEHGCAYCDGRAERYWVEGEFDRDIVARTNLPDLLETELPKLRERGFITIGSGITDAYQPAEEELRLTRRCAEILADSSHPVTVITKSARVVRDLDLWRRVNEISRFMLVVSLVHTDDETRAWTEPGASSVHERLETLREFKDAGCATGVLAMPLLPGIHDTPPHVARLHDSLAAVGVDFIQPGGLTLRPGRQKDWFVRRLREHRPDLNDLYAEVYASARSSGTPDARWVSSLADLCAAEQCRTGIPARVPASVYSGHLERYDELQVWLHHMAEEYETRHVDTRRLRTAIRHLMSWLDKRKREYNRHRSWRYEDLSRELFAEGVLESVLANDRLSAHVRDVFADEGCRD